MITADRIREALDYDPETGIFVWKKRPAITTAQKQWNGRYAGKVAGSTEVKHGYIVIGFAGRLHKAHRLAWLYVYGSLPSQQIDHADRDRSNNKISNLRLATDAENARNASKRKDNSSGAKGVSWHSRRLKWQAQINVRGQRKSLGYFEDVASAKAAYDAAAVRVFGDYAALEA